MFMSLFQSMSEHILLLLIDINYMQCCEVIEIQVIEIHI